MNHIFQIPISDNCTVYIHNVNNDDKIVYSAFTGGELRHRKVTEKVSFGDAKAFFFGDKHIDLPSFLALKQYYNVERD